MWSSSIALGSLLVFAACAAHPQEPSRLPPAPVQQPQVQAQQPAGREIQPLPPRAADALDFALDVSFGGGSFRHRTSNSPLDGDSNAAWVRLRFEIVTNDDIGGGLALEGLSAERDLFASSGDDDVDTGGSDLFVFFGMHPGRGGSLEVPVRVGVFGNRYSVHHLNN